MEEGPLDKSLGKLEYKICQDVDRLRQHPELFPDQSSKDSFRDEISKLRRALVRMGRRQRELRKMEKKFGAEIVKDQYYSCRSSFFRGPFHLKRLKPWQQFLYNWAPGAGVFHPAIPSILRPSKDNTSQILPWAGIKLIREYEKQAKLVIDEMREVCQSI